VKILVASVTRNGPEVLGPHFKSLHSQVLPKEVELDFFYLLDPDTPIESGQLLEELGVAWGKCEAKESGEEYEVSESTHHWNKPTFYWLAKQKQKLLDKAKEEKYDYVFFVDSDLVLGPDCIASLFHVQEKVVSAVFWTKWTKGAPALPQVWMEHPYEFQGRGLEAHEHLQKAAERQVWKVGGLGACTLIAKEVFDKLAWYPILPNLPEEGMWQGEDRSFCIRATRNHVPLIADAWPDIFHIYRPSDLPNAEECLQTMKVIQKEKPEFGDLVSAQLSPTEEMNLAGWSYHLRGRLGQMRILPDIELALLSMKVGDDKFVRVRFPVWWKVPEYAGKTMQVRVKLLGAKVNTYAPGLEEESVSPIHLFDEYYEEEEDG